MKIIKQTYHIKAPSEKVWQALVDPKIIEQWSGTKAKMDDKVGTHFELWDGDMYGTNTEVVTNKKLAQDWYGGDWKKPSKVVFTLSEKAGVTTVGLGHWDLPDSEFDDFAQGWKDYYLGAIKELLEKS